MRLPAAGRITVRPATQQSPRAKRLSRRAAPVRIQITPRDRSVFCALAQHRLLTAEQLRHLVFPTTQPRRVRGRLRLLYDAHFIDRVGVVAQPTAGVPPFLYSLAEEGAALASEELGRPVQVPTARNSSLRFVAHHVGVCDFFVTLTRALRSTDWTMGQWQHEWDLKVSGDSGTRRGERVHVTDPDTQQELALTVLPDAYFTLTRPSGVLHFFFEHDRSTHRLRRWRERALAFTAYARQGHFARRFEGQHFRLLILTPPDFRRRSRADNVVETIEQAVGPSDLFLVTTTAELTPDTLLTPIWRQPGSRVRQAPLGPTGRPRAIVRVQTRATNR